MFCVAVDDGHGMKTAGKRTPLFPDGSYMPENAYNRAVASYLMDALKRCGFRVLAVAPGDEDTSLQTRVKRANDAKADAYIRIHANGSDNSSISGALTICTTRNSPYISSMYRKNKALSEAVLNAYVSATGCRKEYVWETDSMTGNNWSKVPTTIIEMGYMSNPSEDRRMQQSSYQKKMVRGIANGIENYLIK